LPPWPRRTALFLDLDGTLLEFADEPGHVAPPERLRRLLARLPEATCGALAFVSGRPLDGLDRILAPHRFAAAGIHGLERRTGTGGRATLDVDADSMARLRPELDAFAAANSGIFVEDKRISLALHFRKRSDLTSAVRRFIDDLRKRLPPHLEILPGNYVYEIKPNALNKGDAIAKFMGEEPFVGRTPVFIGDDVTDEAGFRVVNDLGGISVKVDSGDSVAQWRLPDVDAVLGWLEKLVERR
jgi:trehalose 6-phosphate phosphatase